MTSEFLAALLRVNLAIAVAVLVVLVLRGPVRRLFGAETAYGLWAAPPLAALGAVMPPRTVEGAAEHTALAAAVAGISTPALAGWTLGVVVAAGGLAWAQTRFIGRVRAGRSGPAVVGVIAPRIVMPLDDGGYSESERTLIRAHERQHVARQDPRAVALASLMQTLFWFNPLVHLGAWAMRLDQELACDAGVLRRRPHDRALYARTLLKTQLAGQPPPLGCHWPPHAIHPLEVRIDALRTPFVRDGLVGNAAVGVLLAGAALSAWSIQPPAPRQPPPVIALGEHTRGPTMSVVLITVPRDRS